MNGRDGGRAIVIENDSADDIRGASQQFLFEGDDQPAKLTITAWSRCENVSEPGDGHYSVWVDAVCNDGTVFNGHSSRFPIGTHDWQQATLTLEPPAPIRTMRLFLLFRLHSLDFDLGNLPAANWTAPDRTGERLTTLGARRHDNLLSTTQEIERTVFIDTICKIQDEAVSLVFMDS